MATSGMTHLVYGYLDPRTDVLRYIGKSSRGLQRPRQFVSHSNRCLAWIKSLAAAGLKPTIVVLEELPAGATFEQLNAAERRCIAYAELPWRRPHEPDRRRGRLAWVRLQAQPRDQGQDVRCPDRQHKGARQKDQPSDEGPAVSPETRREQPVLWEETHRDQSRQNGPCRSKQSVLREEAQRGDPREDARS